MLTVYVIGGFILFVLLNVVMTFSYASGIGWEYNDTDGFQFCTSGYGCTFSFYDITCGEDFVGNFFLNLIAFLLWPLVLGVLPLLGLMFFVYEMGRKYRLKRGK